MRLSAAATLLVLALPATSAHAAEAYDNCEGFIDSLPAVVTTQGIWCLRQDLATSIATGVAIEVAANNVTIDCNGFKIGGLAAGPDSLATAISAYGRNNIGVRDCLIRGFDRAVSLYETSGGLVEDVVAEGNYGYGILVYGNNCTIRRNRVLDTGSSNNDSSATGIYGSCDILDNTVSEVEQLSALGIRAEFASGHTVQGNRIRGIVGESYARGIIASSSPGAVLRDNHVRGIGLLGIDCVTTSAVAIGNVVSGFATGVDTECQDEGNVVVP